MVFRFLAGVLGLLGAILGVAFGHWLMLPQAALFLVYAFAAPSLRRWMPTMTTSLTGETTSPAESTQRNRARLAAVLVVVVNVAAGFDLLYLGVPPQGHDAPVLVGRAPSQSTSQPTSEEAGGLIQIGDDQVVYTEGATRAQASELAEALTHLGYLNEDGNSVGVRVLGGPRIRVQFPIHENALGDPVREAYRSLGEMLTVSPYGGRPIQVELTSPYFHVFESWETTGAFGRLHRASETLRVFYRGGVTAHEARTLGRALISTFGREQVFQAMLTREDDELRLLIAVPFQARESEPLRAQALAPFAPVTEAFTEGALTLVPSNSEFIALP